VQQDVIEKGIALVFGNCNHTNPGHWSKAMPYAHLSLEERICLAGLYRQGFSIRAMAVMLERHPSTLSRELTRNRSPVFGLYNPVAAHRRAQKRQQWERECPKSKSPQLLEQVRQGIERGWSPEQIAGRLRLEHPEDKGRWISHQTIYALVAGDPRLARMLRRAGKKKKKRYGGGADGRGRLRGCRPISQRPGEVERRARLGDWEGDVMRGGKGKAVVMGFVERKSGFFLAGKGADRSAQAMLEAARKAFLPFPHHLRLTLTLDNGKENACHRDLERHLGFKVYFADPGSAWQKGSVENTFGLLRQYMPKKADIAQYSARQVEGFVSALNNRPRKRLGYRTPSEAFLESMCRT
jgi:transposase, IS30 family